MLNERMDFLRCHELWAGLPERSLQALAEAMSPTQHEEGDTIIAQGDSGSRLYVLVAGRAEARIPTPGGEVIVVAQFGEGDCFGEMSLLSGDAASADVVATERCRALSLDREAFDGLVVTDPRLLQGFVRVVTRRLRDTNRAVARAWDKGQEIVRFLHEQSPRYDAFVGTHPTIRELRSRLEDYSRREDPLVLQGERGVGKEFAARLIHQNSARSGGRLVSVDCARLAETPWGDPLFGAADRAEAAGAADGEVCFVALAEGGSILLKNVEALPPTIQERLVHFLSGEEEPTGVRARARVMATSRGEIEEAAAAGRVLPSLARLLTPHTIHLPPLRGRKRDVPALARHFVLKHAGRLKKPVVGLSDPALVKLVAYDYRLANVDELEQAIERAVIMSDDRLVDAPEVILGPPPEVRSRGLNLLRAPERIVALALRVFPGVFRGLAAAVFLGIIIHCFAERSRGGGHPALTLVWSLWWPLLALSFLLVGRAWCAVCPLALAGAAVQRLGRRKSRIPEKMTRYEAQIVMAGFLGIVWVEEATHMRHSPVATGFLLLSLLIGAVTASALLPRRAWCRHLCPLGGFAGLCSRAAALELRPTADVCAAKCKDHSCYKGSGGVAGCPMFNHVMFVDSNQHCVLCMNCIRSCPSRSPQLNLRPPARELWHDPGVQPVPALFVAASLGLVAGLALLQDWERQGEVLGSLLLAHHRFPFVSAALALSAALPMVAVGPALRRSWKARQDAAACGLWNRIAAWTPLMAAGFASYQLGYGLGLPGLQATLTYGGRGEGLAPAVSFSVLALVRFVLLSAGLVVTAVILWKLEQDQRAGDERKASWTGTWVVSLAGPVLYWAVVQVLMLRPDWLTG